MKKLGSGSRLVIVASIGALMMIAQAQTAVSCHKINANGAGQDLRRWRDADHRRG